MKMLDLFAGTRSVSRVFEQHGWETYSVEWDRKFQGITMYADISKLTSEDIIKMCGGRPNVIWASPDCTSYSVMAISKHRERTKDGTLIPKSDYAKFCDSTNEHVLKLIEELDPDYFFIENPVGALRKMPFMLEREGRFMTRHTVTYCQYGETRQKPTDIWTNHKDPGFKPACHRGDPCHEPAPRGSKNGTQKIKGSMDRARIPQALCEHIVEICGPTYGPIRTIPTSTQSVLDRWGVTE